MRAAGEAVQIHGGYGFIKDFPVEKLYRDVKLMTIGEGTSEVQKMIIARNMLEVTGAELTRAREGRMALIGSEMQQTAAFQKNAEHLRSLLHHLSIPTGRRPSSLGGGRRRWRGTRSAGS